ncbi:MAG: ATPase [Elusimicrobia bacterium HGW-Elusimicrobia-4]|nr:MAG: ATPase [Elusimicrobia bacterium HGW-Elusimicrobia-4]
MRKEDIVNILNDWNFWDRKIETGTMRPKYLERMQKFERTGQIITITGVRRGGKSTLMLQYIKSLIEGGVESRNTLYLNLEETRFSPELSLGFLQEAYEAYKEFLEPAEKPYIFMDEVQNVPGWERFARSLHERKEAHLFVSGSSSKILSDEVGSLLTGRHIGITVFPLDFDEFLSFRNILIKSKMDLISKRTNIKKSIREFIKWGGFPLVVFSDEKRKILTEYFEDIISRDVVGRFKIRRADKVRTLASHYLTNISSPITFNSIKKFIGLPLDTVERYSYFLEYAQLIFFVKKFSHSLKEQEVNPRKVYCIDTGLRNAVCFRTSEDTGKLYENAVFLKLLKDNYEIYYWKGKKECDFIVKGGADLKAIQVCYDLERAREREIGGLVDAMEGLNLSGGLVVTGEYEGEEIIGGRTVRFVPLWRFLIS